METELSSHMSLALPAFRIPPPLHEEWDLGSLMGPGISLNRGHLRNALPRFLDETTGVIKLGGHQSPQRNQAVVAELTGSPRWASQAAFTLCSSVCN